MDDRVSKAFPYLYTEGDCSMITPQSYAYPVAGKSMQFCFSPEHERKPESGAIVEDFLRIARKLGSAADWRWAN